MKASLALAIPLVLALAVPLRAGEPDVLAPRIVCPTPNYDFGSLENSQTVEHDYLIRNEGQLTLEIKSVRASCGCTAASSASDTIAPGAESFIHARFALKGRVGFQQKSITVECNDPVTPSIVLQLQGTAVQSLRATPSSIFFGRLGAGSLRHRQIDVECATPGFSIVSISSSSPYVSAQVLPSEASDTVRPVLVTLSEETPEGPLTATLSIVTDIADGVNSLDVVVNAFIAPPAP